MGLRGGGGHIGNNTGVSGEVGSVVDGERCRSVIHHALSSFIPSSGLVAA